MAQKKGTYTTYRPMVARMIDAAAPHVTHDSMITNSHFLAFENIPELREIYDSLEAAMGKYALNPLIGLLIKEIYHLENTGRTKSTSALAGTVTKH
jgi:hypothetical protein